MNPCEKTKGKYNESVSNEFTIMRKSNSFYQIMRVRRENNETNSPYSCLFNYFLIHFFDIMNSLKSGKTHCILIQ